MIFESRIKRQYLVSIIFSILPVLFVAYVLTLAFRETAESFLVAVLVVFGLSTALWIVGAILHWLYFFAAGRRMMARAMADSLLSNKYPMPQEYQQSAISYFDTIAKDATLPLDIRMNAVGDLATFNAFRLIKHSIFLWQLEIAAEDSITLHANKLHEIEAIAARKLSD